MHYRYWFVICWPRTKVVWLFILVCLVRQWAPCCVPSNSITARLAPNDRLFRAFIVCRLVGFVVGSVLAVWPRSGISRRKLRNELARTCAAYQSVYRILLAFGTFFFDGRGSRLDGQSTERANKWFRVALWMCALWPCFCSIHYWQSIHLLNSIYFTARIIVSCLFTLSFDLFFTVFQFAMAFACFLFVSTN